MTTGPARLILLALGWVFVALGVVGVFLPVMPTTPFMLVALWCFARSSRRFHEWLFHHRLFGPPLQQWERHGVIPLKVKVIALASMVFSIAYVLAFTHTSPLLIGIMACSCTVGAVFILSRPHRPRPQQGGSQAAEKTLAWAADNRDQGPCP